MSKKDKNGSRTTEKNGNTATETTETKKRTPFADKTIEDTDKYLIVETRVMADVLGEKIKVKAFNATNKKTGEEKIVRNIRKAYAWLLSMGLISRKASATKTANPKIALLRATVLFTDRATDLAASYGEDCPIDFERLNKWVSKMEKATDTPADSIRKAAEAARKANKDSRDKKIAAAKKDVQ